MADRNALFLPKRTVKQRQRRQHTTAPRKHARVAGKRPFGGGIWREYSSSSVVSTQPRHRKERVSTRRFIASTTPTIGFFPYGLLGLLLIAGTLLYGVTRFANTSIESDVERSVRDSLRADFPWVDVSVNGQHVTLSGEGSERDGAAAMEVAQRTAGSTWAGALVAPEDVSGDFRQPPAAPEPAWADSRAQLEGGVLTLRGEVADEESRRTL
ncbi:MAG: BON domain-containing protein, partial [Polyangiales bacterium]